MTSNAFQHHSANAYHDPMARAGGGRKNGSGIVGSSVSAAEQIRRVREELSAGHNGVALNVASAAIAGIMGRTVPAGPTANRSSTSDAASAGGTSPGGLGGAASSPAAMNSPTLQHNKNAAAMRRNESLASIESTHTNGSASSNATAKRAGMMGNLAGANTIQLLRLLLLKAEAASRIGNQAVALESAQEAWCLCDAKSAHAAFVFARELLKAGRIQQSDDMFREAEALLAAGVHEYDGREDANVADAWAFVGVDPELAPLSIMPVDDCSPTTAAAASRRGSANTNTSTPLGSPSLGSASAIVAAVSNGGGPASTVEWHGELQALRSHAAQARALRTLVEQRTAPNTFGSLLNTSRFLARRGAGGSTASGIPVIIVNYTGAVPLEVVGFVAEDGVVMARDLPPPEVIPPGRLGACAITGKGQSGKAAGGSLTIALRIDRFQLLHLRIGIDKSGGATGGVRIEMGPYDKQFSNNGTLLPNDAPTAARPTVPPNWHTGGPLAAESYAAMAQRKEADEALTETARHFPPRSCRQLQGKRHFGPIAYACSLPAPASGAVLQATANAANSDGTIVFSVQEVRPPSLRPSPLVLANALEFIHPSYRHVPACVNRSMRALVHAQPPHNAYYAQGVVLERVMASTTPSELPSAGLTFRARFPAYALADDYLHSPFTVRDREGLRLQFHVDRGSISGNPTTNLTAFLPNNGGLLFHMLVSAGMVLTDRFVFFGPSRRTMLLSLHQSKLNFLSSKVADVYGAALPPSAKVTAPPTALIGRIDTGPDKSLVYVASFGGKEAATPHTAAAGSSGALVTPATATDRPLYAIKRRMYPGSEVVERMVVRRGGPDLWFTDTSREILPVQSHLHCRPPMPNDAEIAAINKSSGVGVTTSDEDALLGRACSARQPSLLNSDFAADPTITATFNRRSSDRVLNDSSNYNPNYGGRSNHNGTGASPSNNTQGSSTNSVGEIHVAPGADALMAFTMIALGFSTWVGGK